MQWIVTRLARLFGTTLEDWLTAAILIVTIALAVGGARSCAYERFLESRTVASGSR